MPSPVSTTRYVLCIWIAFSTSGNSGLASVARGPSSVATGSSVVSSSVATFESSSCPDGAMSLATDNGLLTTDDTGFFVNVGNPGFEKSEGVASAGLGVKYPPLADGCAGACNRETRFSAFKRLRTVARKNVYKAPASRKRTSDFVGCTLTST